jgi:hypothetical protein
MAVLFELTAEYRNQIVDALAVARENFEGSDAQFARKYGINAAIYSRIKKGDFEKVIKTQNWLALGQALDVYPNERKWTVVETDVFKQIREEIDFCRTYHKAMTFVDDCAIGKTFTARYLSRTMKNVIYIDCSQCKTKILFAKALAKALGIEYAGNYSEVKQQIKYFLNTLKNPVVVLDEAGDVDYSTFCDLKEYWNATENRCGWYMMGADGLKKKMMDGINRKTTSYRELFSRYSDKFSSIVPTGKTEKAAFYRKLITDVLSQNMKDLSKLPEIVNRCLTTDTVTGMTTGLRRAESLLILLDE